MLLKREEIYRINENLSINIDDNVFIHHPITGDIVNVTVVENNRNTVLVRIPESSDYYGQPDFEIKKYQIISK